MERQTEDTFRAAIASETGDDAAKAPDKAAPETGAAGERLAGTPDVTAAFGIVEEMLAGMSLRDKIGQMLICGFEGTSMDGDLRRLIADYKIGGVIYFARNVESPAQIARLTADLQEAATQGGTPPLWISIDQEGGMVARITEGVALMPGGMAIAAAGSEKDAYLAAYASGRELAAMGINLNYAPVLDVNNNPANPVIGVRSFGESPEEAARLGAQTLRGLQDAGVGATAKHFPGHGDTDVDSHLDLPTVPHDRERMEAVELKPFREAIRAGVDAIMSAHIYFPALESWKLPVTLSRAVLTGLLREELGFEGIITTDCMEMNAIAEHFGTVEASVMAVEAGADLILVSHRLDRQLGAIRAIEQAVEEGRLSAARIDESVRRLLAMKLRRGILGGGLLPEGEPGNPAAGIAADPEPAAGDAVKGVSEAPDLSLLNCIEHRELARRISEASMTLVRHDLPMLPLGRERTLVVTIAPAVATLVDESMTAGAGLGSALKQHGLDCGDVIVPPDEIAGRLKALVQEAASGGYGHVVIGTYNAQFDVAQISLVNALLALGKPLAVAALRNPYDLLAFPEVQVYAAAYESRPLALDSMAKALLGLIPFRGHLPVSLGELYPAGWGLEL
ncbi:beta-N-acetylhexosaminidase [Paenibacillus forsythiae]|uniref:beta-N-acetylhexosaminidase n=2 Tax=Paenibacillus forsythiae TaxID=365616 RepID=A0ABU3H2H5_9BACL|nr:beta-N-acetylhexosaminidase [Paenibacillus forsythiae]MDT3424940.1 beta-N-acetylhexosaminidase [Paenibacillus forsythiae]